jgi:hypothetical protein
MKLFGFCRCRWTNTETRLAFDEDLGAVVVETSTCRKCAREEVTRTSWQEWSKQHRRIRSSQTEPS